MRKRKKEKRPSRLRKAIYPLTVILVVGVCAYTLLPGFEELEKVHARIGRLRQISREKESRNEALKNEIASMHTSEGIELAARRHLRLARPDEVIVIFQSPEEGNATE